MSVSNIITNVVSRTTSQTTSRYNALLNDFFGGSSQKIGVNDVFEIFQKIERFETELSLNYSEQKAIGQKATIVWSGPELKKYSLPVKLHALYCNPDDIIAKLEEKAKLKEVFSLYLFERYIGEFVVTKVSSNIVDCINGVTIFAEITVDLIEYYSGEVNSKYSQQTKKQVTNTTAATTLTTKKVTDVVSDEAVSIFERLTDSVIKEATRTAESYVNSTIGGLYGGI